MIKASPNLGEKIFHTHTYAYTYAYIHTYIHTYIYTHRHIYTHIHMHMHRHTLLHGEVDLDPATSSCNLLIIGSSPALKEIQ